MADAVLLPRNFHSKTPTLGVELELWLVDVMTGDLVDRAPELLARFEQHDVLGPRLKKELFEAMIEVTTAPQPTVGAAIADLDHSIGLIRREIEVLAQRDDAWKHVALVPVATHPFANPLLHAITKNDRLSRIKRSIGENVRRMLTAGLHVHVGMPAPDVAIHATQVMAAYAPLLMAVTASSPFAEGLDSGSQSARQRIFGILPNTGLPPSMDTYAEYEQALAQAVSRGAGDATAFKAITDDAGREAWWVEASTELWWQSRPNGVFGTAEARAAEPPPTLRETGAVVALIQCLVAPLVLPDLPDPLHVRSQRTPFFDREITETNLERAAQAGIAADFVQPDGGTIAARDLINRVVAALTRDREFGQASVAEQLQCVTELGVVAEIVRMGTSADYQRQIVAAGGTLHDVIDVLVSTFQRDRRYDIEALQLSAREAWNPGERVRSDPAEQPLLDLLRPARTGLR